MFLAIDIGNTNIVFGLFRGERLLRTWRLSTVGATKATLHLALCRGDFSFADVTGVAVASVVPRLDRSIAQLMSTLFGVSPFFVTWKTAGIFQRQLGADRIANVAAAFARYHRPCIVVDFGTATTFDVVTKTGAFAGGAIAPGVLVMHDALINATAKLKPIPLRFPPRIIGKRTSTNIQSGILHGYVGLVDHLVTEMVREMRQQPVVIATGGWAHLIARRSRTITALHPNLTLEGIKLIWERNCC